MSIGDSTSFIYRNSCNFVALFISNFGWLLFARFMKTQDKNPIDMSNKWAANEQEVKEVHKISANKVVVPFSGSLLALSKIAPQVALTTRKWITTSIGLGAIPFIVHPIDTLVHYGMDNTTRYQNCILTQQLQKISSSNCQKAIILMKGNFF